MLLIAYGTRPEYIKLKPLMKVLNIPFRTLFTGQHEDIVNGEADIIIDLMTGDNRLDDITCSILRLDYLFEGVDHVLVQGDTTTAFSVALAAFHRRIPVIHLEAGLRTHDIECPYPEEFNRTAIDKMSDLLFCATTGNLDNLLREGIAPEKIFVTGNTGLDNLVDIIPENGCTVFCTLHRRENLSIIKEWFSVISGLADTYKEYNFIIPLHPNPAVQEAKQYLGDNIEILEPISHESSLFLLRKCLCVITDSGGVQEEASFLNKRVFVCRRLTERTECVGNTSILCRSPEELNKNFRRFLTPLCYEKHICPYGDGHASERIVRILEEKYG